ncbi:hypothetical protein MBANPS3_011652 [Mucor bainieri]
MYFCAQGIFTSLQEASLMNYPGKSELEAFIAQEEKPTLTRFVRANKEDIARWSVPVSYQTRTALHGIWWKRFKQAVNALKKPTFNDISWSDIMARAERRRNMVDVYQEAGLEVLATAAGAVTQEAFRQFGISRGAAGSSHATLHFIPSCSGMLWANRVYSAYAHRRELILVPLYTHFEAVGTISLRAAAAGPSHVAAAAGLSHAADDDRSLDAAAAVDIAAPPGHSFFHYANKKFLGTLTAADHAELRRMAIRSNDIRAIIDSHVLDLLRKPKLTGYEEEMLKALLSKTVNLLDESCYADLSCVLGAESLAMLESRNFDMLPGLDPECLLFLDGVIDNRLDADSLLPRLEEEKIDMLRRHATGSLCYTLVLVLISGTYIQSTEISVLFTQAKLKRRSLGQPPEAESDTGSTND